LRHRDPYTLLVSVLLSAQCTDKRVNQVTPHLFALADHPATMAAQEVETIREIIHACGLAPTKARNIRALSRQLVEEHGGRVPADQEALERLPGVGHKTASVVLSQAFGQPTFPVDTHILRSARRWGLSEGTTPIRVERDLMELFPQETWGRRHLQIIYFGREHCPARHHDFRACPICAWANPEGIRSR
jgi:endonuclease-3